MVNHYTTVYIKNLIKNFDYVRDVIADKIVSSGILFTLMNVEF